MYRVLAARSLKFLEQRQEDTINYQRQYKEARAGAESRRGSSPTRRSDRADLVGEESDYPRVRDTRDGGSFNVTYPEKSPAGNGAYSRQVGERAVHPPPLLGKSSKDAAAAAATTEVPKVHALIVTHEKKDKSDQLNLRIQTSVERQKLQTHILVDDVMQRRLKKKRRKDLSISASLASLRGQKMLASHTVASNKDLLGLGVWSSLGSEYLDQGPADLDLPGLNAGVPLRELTKSKQVRPSPLKEASDHRKKYETLVELFRTQRHRVMTPIPRDGQDGVPRPQSSKPAFTPSSLAAALGANPNHNAAWDVHPMLSDMGTSSEAGQNPANQSLLARLYQTQSQGRFISAKEAAEAEAEAAAAAAVGGEQGTTNAKRIVHSASAGQLRGPKVADLPPTSVERIAALQPRRMGWDATSVRPLASSASGLFERRTIGAAGVSGVGHAQKLLGMGVSLTSLPDGHPAHTHANILPQSVTPAIAKQMAADAANADKEARNMLGGSGSAASLLGVRSASEGDKRSSSPSRVHFSSASSPSKVGLMFENGVRLHPDHPEYAKRRHENHAIAAERAQRKQQRDEEKKRQYEDVIKQLEESRLDHLHRWRNAFDGTKQKMDRLLIKRLVSRAEERAAALDGGRSTMEPIVDAVLSEQELTEVAGDPAFLAHSNASAKFAKHRREYNRDTLLEDDFSSAYNAVYEERPGYHDIEEGDEETDDASPVRRTHHHSAHDSTARQDEAAREYQSRVADDPSTLPHRFYQELAPAAHAHRATNKSGQQQSAPHAHVHFRQDEPDSASEDADQRR